MSADFDFLARHGKQHVILGSGERLDLGEPFEWERTVPRNEGVCLVAGKAQRGGLRSVARLPRGRACLSPNYRWLGIQEEANPTLLQTFDMENEARPGFRFEAPEDSPVFALHPSGEMLACRDGDCVKLLLPDGRELNSMAHPWPGKDGLDAPFLFSPCGGYLWLAYNGRRKEGTLLLLRCPNLEVLEVVDSSASRIDFNSREGDLIELTATSNPAANQVALRQLDSGWDNEWRLHFFSVRGDKMHLHKKHVGTTHLENAPETLADPIFDARGKRFLVLDSDGVLNEFSFPNCKELSYTNVPTLEERSPGSFHIGHYAYSGDHVLVTTLQGSDQGELWVLRANKLGLQSRLTLGNCTAVLANGRVLRAGPGKSEQELLRFEVESRSIRVAAELDSENNRIRAVHAKEGSEWRDVTSEVGWVETNFRLDPKD